MPKESSTEDVRKKFDIALNAFVDEYAHGPLTKSQWSDILLMHLTGGFIGDGGNVDELMFLESMRGAIERRLLDLRGAPRLRESILQ